MIFDVDNHPVAYVLLMKTLARQATKEVRQGDDFCVEPATAV